MDEYDADSSRSSSPHLPRIDTGYDTPGSDYMSALRPNPRQSSVTYPDYDNERLFAPSSAGVSSISKSQTNSATYSKGKATCKSYDGSACSRRHSRRQSNQSEKSENGGKRKSIPREITVPGISEPKHKSLPKKASTDLGLATVESPLKLSLAESPVVTKFASARTTPGDRKPPWIPPKISAQRYNEARARIMDGGKFKSRLRTYFREDVPWWESKSDSEDDGYDTDLDKQLGTLNK